MNQKALARWIKAAIITIGVIGLFLFAVILPSYGLSIASNNPEYAYCFLPWFIFLCVCGIPCYAALVLGWLIAGNIGKNKSFSAKNAFYLRVIAWLAACDALFFFLGNVLYLFLNMSHPGITLLSLLVVLGGNAFAVLAAALSHQVKNAAELQTQSDLTI